MRRSPEEARRPGRRAIGLVLLASALLGASCGGGDAAAQEPEAERLELGTPPDRSQPAAGLVRSGGQQPAQAPTQATLPQDVANQPDAPGPGPDDLRRPDPPALDAELQRRVAAEIERAVSAAAKASKGKVGSKNAQVAVHVTDAEGRTLVAIQSRTPLRPASNLKLLTAHAAWTLLGPRHTIDTGFDALGRVDGGRLAGDLVARAAGDPLFAVGGDGSITRWVDDLAAQLRRSGITEITGDLVLDEGSFPSPAPGPQWPSENEYWKAYCGLAGGFSANGGCLTATCVAGRVGARSESRVRPRHHGLQRRGSVDTVARGARLDVAVEARGNRVVVRGRQPVDASPWDVRMAHPDPVELFGQAILGGLRDRGISISGLRRQRGLDGGTRVATLRTPWVELLEPILLDSDNPVADQLFLHLGHAVLDQGNWDGGARAVTRALNPLAATGGEWALMDGSGLSRANKVRARQLTAALVDLLGREDSEPYFAALPMAGRTGKLANRMRGGPAEGRVRGKTGFIGGTSGLSGTIETAGGQTLAYAILVNYPRHGGLNTSCWKPMQDRICELLAGLESHR